MNPGVAPASLSLIRHQANQTDHQAFAPRRPDETILFKVIQENWLSFRQDREEEGRFLPRYVTREFDEFLQCGQLANGFLRLKCDSCRNEKLVPFSCKKRSFCSSCAARRMSENAAFFVDRVLPHERIRQWVLSTPIPLRFWMAQKPSLMTDVLTIMIRAVSRFYSKRAKKAGVPKSQTGSITLIQRAGGAANLNVHFHSLFIEGVYEDREQKAVFHQVIAPDDDDVRQILEEIQTKVIRLLAKQGYIQEKEEGVIHPSDLVRNPEEVEKLCQEASVQSRIALGERAGQRVRRVGSFGKSGEQPLRDGPRCYSVGGFSIHANTEAELRQDIETLCRYIARPPIAVSRLKQLPSGDIVYRFKSEWSDGTRGVLFSPEEFIEKLVALVIPPRIHVTRFHGVLAPNSRLRPQVVPGFAPELLSSESAEEEKVDGKTKRSRPRRLSWAALLKRVFQIDISVCSDCGGQMNFIATIMDPKVVCEILEHLGLPTEPPRFAPARAPPQAVLFDSGS